MAAIIPIDLAVDVAVIMVPKVEVMLALQITHTELVQTVPLSQSLVEDKDITDILNNMINYDSHK